MRKSIYGEIASPLPLHPNRVTEYVATTRGSGTMGLLETDSAAARLPEMRKSGIFRKLNVACEHVTRSNDAYTLRFGSLPSMRWIIVIKREA